MDILNDKIASLIPGTICILGVPLDKNSSFRRGPALAPMRIMEQFHSDSANLCAENGVEEKTGLKFRQCADCRHPETAARRICRDL